MSMFVGEFKRTYGASLASCIYVKSRRGSAVELWLLTNYEKTLTARNNALYQTQTLQC